METDLEFEQEIASIKEKISYADFSKYWFLDLQKFLLLSGLIIARGLAETQV